MHKPYAFFWLIVSLAFLLLTNFAKAANPQVTFETNRGNFVEELYPDKAPITVDNFLKYVKSGFYNETIFHRVIDHFMIQGGGFNADMSEKKTLASISNEASNGLLNEQGTIAMARTNDPNSATAQFFINLENNLPLNYQGDEPDLIGYCVFGRVLQGMDVVREIGVSPTINVGPYYNVPKSPILIHQVKLNINLQ